MAQQQLDGAQVSPGLKQMSREAMAQRVRMQRLVPALLVARRNFLRSTYPTKQRITNVRYIGRRLAGRVSGGYC